MRKIQRDTGMQRKISNSLSSCKSLAQKTGNGLHLFCMKGRMSNVCIGGRKFWIRRWWKVHGAKKKIQFSRNMCYKKVLKIGVTLHLICQGELGSSVVRDGIIILIQISKRTNGPTKKTYTSFACTKSSEISGLKLQSFCLAGLTTILKIDLTPRLNAKLKIKMLMSTKTAMLKWKSLRPKGFHK